MNRLVTRLENLNVTASFSFSIGTLGLGKALVDMTVYGLCVRVSCGLGHEKIDWQDYISLKICLDLIQDFFLFWFGW